jgi:hypothetical protein
MIAKLKKASHSPVAVYLSFCGSLVVLGIIGLVQ